MKYQQKGDELRFYRKERGVVSLPYVNINISADPLAKLEGEATGKDKTNANSFDLLFSFH